MFLFTIYDLIDRLCGISMGFEMVGEGCTYETGQPWRLPNGF